LSVSVYVSEYVPMSVSVFMCMSVYACERAHVCLYVCVPVCL